ncbi:hypothetical protein RV09_GL000091 [Enterococcus moraviensis]|nr:hypothetical protein RV09_GL000091 [Enterococcus moraviensis]
MKLLSKNYPGTIKEFFQWLEDGGYNQFGIHLSANTNPEGYGVRRIGPTLELFYSERGQAYPEKEFNTEKELVGYLAAKLEKSDWARTHCISATENKDESEALAKKLSKLGIKFDQQELLYSDDGRMLYRTMVYGTDIKKVAHLK